MTSPRPPHAHRFSSSPSPSQHPYLSSTPPISTSYSSTPQPSAPPPPLPPHSSTPQPLHPPSQTLTPFFTLISNPTSTTHKHPIVRYVFSDDDFDPIPPPAPSSSTSTTTTTAKDTERVIIVDMNPSGESVAAAHSLSKDWQVVGVNIASAPQWMAGDEDPGGAGSAAAAGGAGGLMLTIRGLEVPKSGSLAMAAAAGTASGATGGGGVGKESLYELAEMYHERIADIKSVIEYAEKSSNASIGAEPEA
ncbi:hypothetical protein L873DRAFT_1691062 [Choiromyces venosus 120613-1]|uniref:Uncharacterized protein n=1 Tax=Choiromyces venosus 120613-1 TaxID=1336337 RepID=A0A3N4JGH6_9PEZI|nr:hypothetical protein L873DRAFT_1691062 [Choiromyces venosus 120613-1]